MLSALNDSNGGPVDWWFAYKIPYKSKPPSHGPSGPSSTGFEYLYYDADGQQDLKLSPNMLHAKEGVFYSTLSQLFGDPSKPVPDNQGWILYNDEIPDKTSNDGSKGHTKGVIGFNTAEDSAFWLLHSTPRYPLPRNPEYPLNEKIYGQTYLCITLKDIATAESIAAQMLLQQHPQVYGSVVPSSLDQSSALYQLSQGKEDADTNDPSVIDFESRAGEKFKVIAKNRKWGKDFWIDLVGPTLDEDLNVETWRRGTLPGTEDSNDEDEVQDILYVDTSPLGANFEWHYTKDHAKWAVSTRNSWVCVGDINRQKSQEKRGGGTIAFQNKQLWAALSKIDLEAPD